MTVQGFRHEPYDWRGQTEWMFSLGASEGPQAIILPPLFEEMNFTRAFIVDIARGLAAAGIGSWLPDLPGTGESLRDLATIGWDDWRDAAHGIGETIMALTDSRPHVVALRGGALLADAIEGRSWWSFAPASGASLLRQLQRTQIVTDRDRKQAEPSDPERISIYAGYPISAAMRTGLTGAEIPVLPSPHRAAPAELLDDRAKLWRRAEPGRDPELAAKLADDIAHWIATCERH